MPRLRYRLERLGVRSVIALTRVVPRRLMLAFGSLLGLLADLLMTRHRRIALENLTLALGDEISPRRRRRIVRECWRHFARTMVDSLYIPRMDSASVLRMAPFTGEEHAREALAKGRGLIFCSAHFGHWELAAISAGYRGVPIAIVARPLSNPGLEPFLRSLRGVSGNQIIYKRNAIRSIIQALRLNRAVAIMIDQDARERGIFVPFFGRPASTTPAPAAIALRTGASILPVSCVPDGKGRYVVRIQPAIDTRTTGDNEADVRRITAECTSILEGWVRERPEMWLWMHRRWKTQPASTGEVEPSAESAEVS